MFEQNTTLIEIIESWKSAESSLHTLDDILAWIDYKKQHVKVGVKKIAFRRLYSW